MADDKRFTLSIHEDTDGMLWGEVAELPGCFASGSDMDELLDAASEAITQCLTPDVLGTVVSLSEHRANRGPRTVRPLPQSATLVLQG